MTESAILGTALSVVLIILGAGMATWLMYWKWSERPPTDDVGYICAAYTFFVFFMLGVMTIGMEVVS